MGFLLACSGACAPMSVAVEPQADTPLERAQAYVAKSDRYLHQSKLQPGMTGFGRTVMSGVEIQQFDVKVVSVIKNFSAESDVIICELSGLGLDVSGVIAGMSGSPVYIKDPADGKSKLIGAVAYGWPYHKKPICGIQPIVQMLAISGVLEGNPATGVKPASTQATTSSAGALAPVSGATAAAFAAVSSKALAPRFGADFLATVLTPKKVDFCEWAARPATPAIGGGGDTEAAGLAPLATPVMLSGVSPRSLDKAKSLLAAANMVPLQGGAVGGKLAIDPASVKLEPGSAVAVTLAGGDADLSAVGTVTEVIGDRVLCFGHAMYGAGKVDLPIGPAYVHAVIPLLSRSFKLGSSLGVTGALQQDEMTGISCAIGAAANRIPYTINVSWPGGQQKFSYLLARHYQLTPGIAAMLLSSSVNAWHELPEHYTLAYDVAIDYDKLGKYATANVSSEATISAVGSDLTRPLVAMANNDLGAPAWPKSIEVNIKIAYEQQTAEILTVELDRNSYKPGQKVSARVTLRPFRAEKTTQTVAIDLPANLPDGKYPLLVCDGPSAAAALRADKPNRFKPTTAGELFTALKELVSFRADRLYVRLQLPESGLAVKTEELANMPASMAQLLEASAPVETTAFRVSQVTDFPAPCMLAGEAGVMVVVEKEPKRE
jgi:hypothetical protein